MTTDNNETLREQLGLLKEQHKALDLQIQELMKGTPMNQLEVSRLKKKKLTLKDQISNIECRMLPDIIA